MYVLLEGKVAIIFDTNINNEILNMMRHEGVEKVHLFLTHEHYDHSHAVNWLQEHFNTTLYCHRACEGQLSTKKKCAPRLVAFVLAAKDKNDGGNRYEEFKSQVKEYVLRPDVLVDNAEIIQIANHTIRIIHVPGHSPGSCLYIMDEELVFSGDSMIEGNMIITAFKGGNKEDMLNITLPILKALPDDLWVMPGHGNPFKKKKFDFDIYNV